MNQFGLEFHHLGLAVKSEAEADAVEYLEAMDYAVGEKIYDNEQNVNLRMCHHASEPDIEIVLPGDGKGPLDPILKNCLHIK